MNVSRARTIMLTSAAWGVAILATAPAFAQDQDDTTAEIVVTAQRRAESLQNVPVSLTVVGGEALKSRNLNEIGDLTIAAPSLQVGSDNQFSVRGVGTVAFSDTLESSVATAIDEVTIARNLGGTPVFNDIERVEVLSGPQGLLFGKNASAGLINIITKKPQIGNYSADFGVEYVVRDTTPNNGQGVVTKGTVNIPVSANSALRINAQYSYQEPVAVFRGTGSSDQNLRTYGTRVKYLLEPTPDLSIYLIGDYNERHGIAGVFDRTLRELGTGSNLIAIAAAEGITPGTKNLYYDGDGSFFRDDKSGGLQGKVAYTLGNGWEISNIAAWRSARRNQALDTDLTNVQQLSINTNQSKYKQFSNEFRVAIPSENRLNGQFGLYYFDSQLDSQTQLAGFQGLSSAVRAAYPRCVGTVVATACGTTRRDFVIGNDITSTLKEKNYAGFGQLFYKVTDRLQLLAGGRLTYAKLDINTDQMTKATYFVPLVLTGQFSDSSRNTMFGWKVGAQYNLSHEIMTYLTYGVGQKGAGFNTAVTKVGQTLAVEPEVAKSLEAGIKTSWFDNKLIFNASFYLTNFSNYQVQSLDTALQTYVIQNAAKLRSKGAELTLIAKPVRGLTINGGITLQDAVFGDFPGAQCNTGQTCTGGTYNAKGTRLPTAPQFVGTIQAAYRAPISSSVDFVIDGNMYHRSSINYRIGEPAITRLGAADIFGANIGIDFGNFSAKIFCRNCTNKVMPTFINPVAGDANNGIASAIQQWGLNSVRNIGLALNATF